LEGNQVLSAVGAALRQTARRYDVVGRFGGDEFVVLLPETGGRSARVIAHRLRAAVLEAIGATTTVAIGASVGISDWDGESSSVELLDAARRALREAKAAGGGIAVARARERGDGFVELTRNLVRPR